MAGPASTDKGPLVESISTIAELSEKIPKLEGVPTGVEGLDELFFTTAWENGKAKRIPLGGIPRYAVLQVTGVADTGKSLLVEQFAVERARRGEACVFVTIESPGP
ncbi:MAG: KaiC domain-containing protein, partial [Calditrichaeota bacterium]|nr:KaiC domain-containing protein [Calditrichota bacterium]